MSQNPVSIEMSNELQRAVQIPVVSAASKQRDDESDPVYVELGELADFIPGIYRTVFCFRWGLNGRSPHLHKATARRFDHTRHSVATMLEWCLWNVAREAHHRELPALRAMLGENREEWAARAWDYAERWEHRHSRLSEATLLLAVGGMDVAEARSVIGQHAVDIGAFANSLWPAPLTDQERAEGASVTVDRVLEHVLWPSTVARLNDLDAFKLQRQIERWQRQSKAGYFRSEKLARPVQFESDLERRVLRDLDADARILRFQEQPLTIPYERDGIPHDYTPDVIVQLNDGRAFVMEIKPPEHLGEFVGAIKWAALARYCGERGLGLAVGSPARSIVEHRQISARADARELVVSMVNDGPVKGNEYGALVSLVGYEQLGIIATAELLDWRADRRCIKHSDGADRTEAARFWTLVDRYQREAAH